MLQEEVMPVQAEMQGEIDQLLHEFEDVFAEPKALPLHRFLDHEVTEIQWLKHKILYNYLKV